MRIFPLLACVLGLGTASSFAHADPLPAASGFLTCGVAAGLISSSSSCSGTGNSASLTEEPFASIVTQASAPANSNYGDAGFAAFGILDYSFEVTGGAPGDLVPLDIATDLIARVTTVGYAFSEIIISTSEGSVGANICSFGCGDTAAEFAGTLNILARSGDVDSVHFEVEAGDSPYIDANSALASVDPYIYVDPSFAQSADYSIIQSAGVGNGPLPAGTVPEPATWLLMMTGIGAAGLTLRRSRIGKNAGPGAADFA